jgi:two-component system response regulator PrrA
MANSGLIFLVEDDQQLRCVYTAALKAAGYKIVFACDGEQAIKRLYSVQPTLIVLDVSMPNLDGIATCKRARQIVDNQVPIIFLTGHDQVSILTDCIAAGGDDYILKSEGLVAIVARLESWIRKARGSMQLSARRKETLMKLAHQPKPQ